MSTAWLSLGGNIGDSYNYLCTARSALYSHPLIHVKASSSLYVTSPWGNKDQQDFLNAVIQIETALSPEELLCYCQNIEQKAGRERLKHWGARTLDIDILLYDDIRVHTDILQIPHPYLHERRFVLEPLSEITEELPLLGNSRDLLDKCSDTGSVARSQFSW